MIIAPENKLVMLLPWKTASQTLRWRLQAFNRSPYPANFHFNPHLNRVVHQHLTLADFARLPESRTPATLAVFVRNPYDRVYSGFRQLISDVSSQPHWAFPEPWIRDLVLEQLAHSHERLSKAQFDIDRWFASLPEHEVLEAGRNSSLPLHPLHYWTHARGRPVAGFIGRVERFEDDFAALCARFGLQGAGTQSVNRSDDGGPRDAKGYRYAGRLGARTIARINALFAADFELFGYERLEPGV
jgi:hypothetical protein